MDLLVRLCHALSGTQFLNGATDGSVVGDSAVTTDERAIVMPRGVASSSVVASPVLGRVCWLVFNFAHRVMRDADQRHNSASARNHARQQLRYLRDFFTLPVEQFIGKFSDDLAKLPFQSRGLVISVKYRLTCTLERECPPSLAISSELDELGDGAGKGVGNSCANEFTRCYYTVASVVPCTDDDYRALLTGNLYGCSCKKNRRGSVGLAVAANSAPCQFCLRAKAFQRGEVGSARCGDPYEPPNPHVWVKLHSGEDRDARSRRRGVSDGEGGNGVLLNGFRRQTIQKDVYETWRRAQHSGGCDSVPFRRDSIRKFRPSSLPRSLRSRSRKHHQPLGEGLYERDLGTLLSHFTINWAKLHYLEPAIVPQYSD